MLLDSVKVKGSPLAFLVNSASTENVGSLKILAYKILKKNTKREVGIGTAPPYFEPASDDKRDAEIANTARYLNNEWVLNAAIKGEFESSHRLLLLQVLKT